MEKEKRGAATPSQENREHACYFTCSHAAVPREKLARTFQVHLRCAPECLPASRWGEQGSNGLEGVPGSAPACIPALERRVTVWDATANGSPEGAAGRLTPCSPSLSLGWAASALWVGRDRGGWDGVVQGAAVIGQEHQVLKETHRQDCH